MIIRPALPGDAAAMTALQNRIIRIGGTTAHQVEHSVEEVREAYITGAGVVCCPWRGGRDRRVSGGGAV